MPSSLVGGPGPLAPYDQACTQLQLIESFFRQTNYYSYNDPSLLKPLSIECIIAIIVTRQHCSL